MAKNVANRPKRSTAGNRAIYLDSASDEDSASDNGSGDFESEEIDVAGEEEEDSLNEFEPPKKSSQKSTPSSGGSAKGKKAGAPSPSSSPRPRPCLALPCSLFIFAPSSEFQLYFLTNI